jgi:hypothetical protein
MRRSRLQISRGSFSLGGTTDRARPGRLPLLVRADMAALSNSTWVREQHPLVVEQNRRRLWRLWQEHRKLAQKLTPGAEVAFSPEQVKALQALGYLQ